MIALTVKRSIVPMGIEIIAYSPGRGAGMKAVVKVLRADMHPKTAEKAISLDERRNFPKAIHHHLR